MRVTILALAVAGAIWAGDTSASDRESVRILQAKRDVAQAPINKLIEQLNNSPEVKAAVALDEQIKSAKDALAKKCAATEVLELDPSKAETYLHCVAKPAEKK